MQLGNRLKRGARLLLKNANIKIFSLAVKMLDYTILDRPSGAPSNKRKVKELDYDNDASSDDESPQLVNNSISYDSFGSGDESASDSGDDEEPLQPTILPVAQKPSQVMDGPEYLRRVREEAAKFPRVLTVKVDPSLRFGHSSAASVDPLWKFALKESQRFNRLFVDSVDVTLESGWVMKHFTELYEMIADRRQSMDITTAPSHLLDFSNSESLKQSTYSNSIQTLIENSLDALIQIPQHDLMRLIKTQVRWLRADSMPFTKPQSETLYYVLACLNVPLSAEDISVLRSLSKKLIELKRDRTSGDDEIVMSMTMIILIVNKHFGQADLQ